MLATRLGCRYTVVATEGMSMKVESIFTPNDIPSVTYVDRSDHKHQQTLRDYYNIPNMVVSISGPSKSGKTVLIKKVISEELLITVTGSAITSGENLWERVLNWMGAPAEVVKSRSSENTVGGEVEGSGSLSLPLIGSVEATANATGERSWGKETSRTFGRGGIDQVVREIANSEFVVFIDDFHYISPDLRDEIGKQLKSAAERGVKIFTASVPHRSDDVVRTNPELRGRVAAIDMTYWTVEELSQISRAGFNAMNIDLAPAVERRFAVEAAGSPQLMQSICLNFCYAADKREAQPIHARLEISEEGIADTLARTSSFTNFAKMVTALHIGPRTRGTERKIHQLRDGTSGDVYRAVLLALKSDPSALSFSYDDLLSRVRAQCIGDAPVGSSITNALEQMAIIAAEIQPGSNPIAWDDDRFDIADPYLLFYLRCSDKVAALGR